MIPRTLTSKLKKLSSQFPAVSILGPRQSGKTTLARSTFPDYSYVSFEDFSVQMAAREDPKAFISNYRDTPGVIFDEIQHVPELFSYMQLEIDEYKKRGHFIVTGSQNFALSQSISQSLAGRIALLTLLPLSIEELKQTQLLPQTIDSVLFRGMYPSLYNSTVEPYDWYRSYVSTYVERDVRTIRNITDLAAFQNFMRLCATRVGQVLNLSSLSNDSGLSIATVKQWMSVLESSYILFFLRPYYRNIGRRLIKSPKLYFYDTGIACSLLSIDSTKDLYNHYIRGYLFENLLIADLIKQRENAGLKPNIYFWRDKSDYEIDCIIEEGSTLVPLEIKSTQSFNTHFLDGFARWNEETHTDPSQNILAYAGDLSLKAQRGKIVNWQEIGNLEALKKSSSLP